MEKKSSNDFEKELLCYICFDPLNMYECMNLTCGKIYHTQCLQSWWKHRESKVCPVCNVTTCVPGVAVVVEIEHESNEPCEVWKRCYLCTPFIAGFIIVFTILIVNKRN